MTTRGAKLGYEREGEPTMVKHTKWSWVIKGIPARLQVLQPFEKFTPQKYSKMLQPFKDYSCWQEHSSFFNKKKVHANKVPFCIEKWATFPTLAHKKFFFCFESHTKKVTGAKQWSCMEQELFRERKRKHIPIALPLRYTLLHIGTETN